MIRLFILLLAGCFALARGAETRVVGSDLLGVEFSKALYAFSVEQRFPLALALDGSRPGLDTVNAGRADAGLIALPATEAKEMRGLQLETVAFHTVVFLVREDCPISSLTLAQLAAIFGGVGTSAPRTWAEVGATGDWSEALLVAAAPEAGAGIAVELFRHEALRDGNLRSQVLRYRGTSELRSLFEREPRMIALAAAMPRESQGLRALLVSARPGQSAVAPTAAALERGEYPLRLPLQFAAKAERWSALQPLRAWLRGADAAKAFERAELVPIREAGGAAAKVSRDGGRKVGK